VGVGVRGYYAGLGRNQMLGYLCIVLAAVLFGVAGAVAKILFNSDISPLALTAARAIVAALILVPILSVWRRRKLTVTAGQLCFLVVLAGLLTLVNITFYYSISLINVAVAIMLEYTAPVFVMIFGLFRGTHVLNWDSILVIVLSLIGGYLLAGSFSLALLKNNLLGTMIGLGCGICFALYNMWGNRGHELGLDSTTMTFYSFVFSAVLWLPLVPFVGAFRFFTNHPLIPHLLFIAIFATVVPYWLLVHGLKHVDAFPATVIGILDPMVAGIAAYLLIDEHLQVLQIIGIAVLLTAIVHSTKFNRSKINDRNGMRQSVHRLDDPV
jgi:drug/metabolite transporter, DME family